MKNFFKKWYQSRKGFTLLETLVGVFILSIAIGATLSAAQTGLRTSFYSRDETTAIFLAQDAMEFIRNMRDENWLTVPAASRDSQWLMGPMFAPLSNCVTFSGFSRVCRIDTTTTLFGGNVGTIYSCITPASCQSSDMNLKIDPATGKYGYGISNTQLTTFNRDATIFISLNPLLQHQAEVVVNVRWRGGDGAVRTLTVKNLFFKWY